MVWVPKTPEEKDRHRQAYGFYNSTLRAWFIAFGVGFPALVLSQSAITKKVTASAWPLLLVLQTRGLLLEVPSSCEAASHRRGPGDDERHAS
jgi:hypothetical protein